MKNPIIEVQDLTKKYQLGKNVIFAIHNVSFSIEKGIVYGIIGQSGAGKSTLIRCLSSLIKPSSGKILFHGKDIVTMEEKGMRNFRKNIGMIFQHFNLLSSRTVEDNISFPLEIAKIPPKIGNAKVHELLNLVGLMEKKEAYPAHLSGGEKQRVGIARAMANDPEILFCDEATSALDPKTTKEILTLLKTINKKLGVTIVLITHEMEIIKQICDEVSVVDKGKIIERGFVADIFANPKHQMTKHFIQNMSHEIPSEFLKKISPNCKLLRLRFKGKVASEPIISEIVRKFGVDANILLGWIDRLQSFSIGTLIIELTGESEGIQNALHYLEKKEIQVEEIKRESG